MFKKAENKSQNCDSLGKATDSGFVSSGNLLVSDEIVSDEMQPVSEISNITTNRLPDREKDENTDLIQLDSVLLEGFSNLSVNDSNITDTTVNSYWLEKQISVAKGSDDVPWKIFYMQDDDGDTYLHTAIVEGFVDVALALIRAVPHPRLLDTPNDDAQTPLHLAVETTQWRIARWLVVAGAKPCPRDLRGDSPLHIAARAGDVKSIKAIADPIENEEREVLRLCREGHIHQPCDFDQWNYLGQTCVHLAALHGQVEVLKQLVWYGADINAREGCMGYTALHYAVDGRDEALVQFLLQCEELNVEVETYGGRNALEIDRILPSSISEALRKKGVPAPYFGDENDDVTDSEDGD